MCAFLPTLARHGCTSALVPMPYWGVVSTTVNDSGSGFCIGSYV